MTGARRGGDALRAACIAAALLVGGAVAAAFDPGDLGEPLALVLLGGAVASRVAAVDLPVAGRIFISGAFLCGMLAAAFVGPAAAFVIPVVTELFAWATVDRYRPVALLINLAASATPTAVAAVVLMELDLRQDGLGFALALAAASIVVIVANTAITRALAAVLDGRPVLPALRPPLAMAPTVGINIAIVAALGVVYAQTSIATISLVLLVLVAFTYMTRLVVQAQERTRQYANLSWGVLSALIRTLDARDKRAARHCAAVARFARDMAERGGLDERDQELAHTAGLLHDIGRFALSDRVMERGVVLTEEDWVAIRRHPQIGADLLRDVDVYGPVAEIILTHHERPDGKGYPKELKREAIPEIALIIAVAEVYDTLTAPDTYRTQLSSFEALTELRRVAGKQLDARWVEVLAELLAGQDTGYRHADAAQYDEELEMERRINEAARRPA